MAAGTIFLRLSPREKICWRSTSIMIDLLLVNNTFFLLLSSRLLCFFIYFIPFEPYLIKGKRK